MTKQETHARTILELSNKPIQKITLQRCQYSTRLRTQQLQNITLPIKKRIWAAERINTRSSVDHQCRIQTRSQKRYDPRTV